MGDMYLIGESEYEQYQFKDEENDFHNFVENILPTILDVEDQKLCVLHEYHNRDFICVDSNGNIYVIECKLGRNPHSRRKVLSQVLDYVHGTHNIISSDSKIGNNQTLEAYFESRIKGFDNHKFRKQLKSNVRKRAINIYIVSDELHDVLITSALNTFVGQRKVPVKVVEAKKFVSESEELSYIRTINDGRKESTNMTTFDAGEYLSQIKNPERRQFCKNLINYYRENHPKGNFTITNSGTAKFSIKLEDELYTIFGLKRNGEFWQSVQNYLNLDPETTLDYYRDYRDKLNLDNFNPKDTIRESACYKMITKKPEELEIEVLKDQIDKLIQKVKENT